MTEIEFQNGSKIKGIETDGKTIRGKVREYSLDSKKKNRGGVIVRIMKNVLKGLWRNYYLIIALVSLGCAYYYGNSNDAVVLYGFFIGCMILQATDSIKSKLEDMDKFYTDCGLMNVEVLKEITELMIAKKKAKEDK